MSNQAITAVSNRVIPGGASAKLVMLCLADHASKEGWSCFPSTGRLAAESQLSERSVGGILRGFEEGGLLHRERRMDGRRRLSDLIVLHRDSILDLPLHAFHDALAGRDGKGSKVVEQEVANQEPSNQEPANDRVRNRQMTAKSGRDTTYREPEVEPSVSAAVAADGPDDLLSTSTAKVTPLTPTDPTKAEARRLAQIAFEQTPKPVCRGGFIGVMKLIQRLLAAGHDPVAIELAVANGRIKTWTLAAMTYALDTATTPTRQAPRNVYLDLLNGTES